MTTYNTGNAIGSVDVRDLYDNAQNLDNFSNGQLDEYTDRFGVSKQSLQGIRNAVRYEVLGPYAAGLNFTSYGQIFSYLGEFYAPGPSITLPYTTTGVGAAEIADFRSVGDAILRQDLADTDGTGLVGRGAGTLEDALDAIELDIVNIYSEASYSENAGPQLMDMHYGVLRGAGFLNGVEPGGVTTTTTTSSVASGQTIPVASNASYSIGQLIAYQATNGDFYSAVVLSLPVNQIIIRTPIESPISSGALIANFYTNESHPTVYGYNAIADQSIRELSTKRSISARWVPADGLVSLGSTSIADLATVSYDNPGSSNTPSKRVITTGLNTGARTEFFTLPAGQYIARFRLTPNLIGSSDISVAASLGVIESTSVEITIASMQVSGNTPTVGELHFFKKHDSTVAFRVLNTGAGTLWTALAEVEIVKVEANTKTLDRGTHVLLGDSWFAQTGIFERLQVRLPNATIINSGVGGNRSDQLVARFDTDVTPNNPQFVWVMAGTNDVAQSIPLNTFGYNIGILNSKISAIAAQGIFFNTSVGSSAHSTLGDILTESRDFALGTDYLGDSGARGEEVVPAVTTSRFATNFVVNVPSGTTRRIAVFPGTTTLGLTINKLYTVGSIATVTGTLRYGYGGGASSTISEDLVSAAMGTTILTNLTVAKTNASPRFFLIEVNNTTGAAYDIIGFVDATWTPT